MTRPCFNIETTMVTLPDLTEAWHRPRKVAESPPVEAEEKPEVEQPRFAERKICGFCEKKGKIHRVSWQKLLDWDILGGNLGV